MAVQREVVGAVCVVGGGGMKFLTMCAIALSPLPPSPRRSVLYAVHAYSWGEGPMCLVEYFRTSALQVCTRSWMAVSWCCVARACLFRNEYLGHGIRT